jgi:hypothetical protein
MTASNASSELLKRMVDITGEFKIHSFSDDSIDNENILVLSSSSFL